MNEKQYLERIHRDLETILGECRRIRKELVTLPKGCLSKKKINGKEYFYMQQRVGNKIETKFIPAANVSELQNTIRIREEKKNDLKDLEELARKIVKSAKVFDNSFYFEIKDLVDDYKMDLLSKEEKQEIIKAETALSLCEWGEETLNKTQDIDRLWANGEITHKEWRRRLDEIYK